MKCEASRFCYIPAMNQDLQSQVIKNNLAFISRKCEILSDRASDPELVFYVRMIRDATQVIREEVEKPVRLRVAKGGRVT